MGELIRVHGVMKPRSTTRIQSFVPTSIANLMLWVNPRDASSYTIVSASMLDPNDFSSASWSKAGGTVTVNDTAAPDGTVTADKWTSAAGAALSITQSPTNGAGGSSGCAPAWLEVYAKYSSIRYLTLESRSAALPNTTFFDLQDGVLGTVGANHSASSIEPAGNGWWRCRTRMDSTNVATLAFRMQFSTTDAVTTNPTTGSSIWLWGASVTQQRISAAQNKVSGVSFVQATAARQFGYVEKGLNGHPSFQGHGGQDLISTEAALVAAFNAVGDHTMFAMVQWAVADDNRVFLSSADSTSAAIANQRGFGQLTSGSGNLGRYFVNDSAAGVHQATTPASDADALPHLHRWRQSGSLTSGITFAADGVARALTFTGNPQTAVIASNNISIGSQNDSSPERQAKALIGEILFFNRALTAGEEAQIASYLSSNWSQGVTI